MAKVALFYPIIPKYKVPTILVELSNLYSIAVSKLYQDELKRRGIMINQPPISKYIVSEGLLSIAAVLKEHGHYVEYFEEQSLLDVGLYDSEIRRIANQFDVVGISVVTPAFPHVANLVAKLKQICPQVVVILGGPHVTFRDEEALDIGADFVVRYEGEEAAAQLIDRLDSDRDWASVPGISYKKGGETIRNPGVPLDVTTLPTPLYELIPPNIRHSASVSLLTNRGCVGACNFCAEGHFFGNLRLHSEQQVVNKVRKYLEVFPYNYIMIHDSTFTSPKLRMMGLVDTLNNKFPNVYFGCNARTDTIDRDIVEMLTKSRFIDILFGGESGSDSILRTQNKGLTAGTVEQALKIVGDKIPFSLVTFMIGHPSESLQTAHATIQQILRLYHTTKVFKINTRLFTPYPGTPAYESPMEFGLRIICNDLSQYTRYSYPAVVSTRYLSQYEIWYLFLESYLMSTMELVRRAGIEYLAYPALEKVDMKEMDYSKTKPS